MAEVRKTILLVDDEVSITAVVTTTLHRMGIDVQAFNDARKALAAVSAMEAQPDLLMTDYHMPEMNGIELIQECRKYFPELPFIVISGTLMLEDPEELPFPGETILSKPFSLAELRDRIHSVLGYQMPVS